MYVYKSSNWSTIFIFVHLHKLAKISQPVMFLAVGWMVVVLIIVQTGIFLSATMFILVVGPTHHSSYFFGERSVIEHEADHSAPSTKDQNMWNFASMPPVYFLGVVLNCQENFTCTLQKHKNFIQNQMRPQKIFCLRTVTLYSWMSIDPLIQSNVCNLPYVGKWCVLCS